MNLENLDRELANIEIDICNRCHKKIRFFQIRVNGFSGDYHKKCFDLKFKEKQE